MWTIVLLLLSNIFMTFAWYGHLGWFKGSGTALWVIVLTSWGIALFEYWFMIPANRMGTIDYGFSGAELKTIQEVITLVVFAAFSVLFLKEKLQWNHVAGFACIAVGALFVFNPMSKAGATRMSVGQPTPSPYTQADTVKDR